MTTNKLLNGVMIIATSGKRYLTKWRNLFALFMLSTSPSLYAALGMPVSTERYAVGYGIIDISVSDPDGNTAGKSVDNVLSLAYSDWFYLDTLYWLEWQSFNTDLAPSEDQIGQFVQHNSLTVSLQKQLALQRYFKPWMNMGAQFAHTRYSLRHTLTDDGFLQQRYDDRNVFSLGFVTGVQLKWDVQRDWALGLTAQQTLVPGHNLSSRSVSLLLFYQP